jgi:putative oxidoreductase
MSIGMLILRLAVGLLFVGHGTQKLFGWFGGGGPDRTAGMFESLGYRPARPMAITGGLAETFGGLSLALGFLTPLGAAAIIGMMLNATLSVHLKNGIWNTKGGFELPLTNAAVATALAFGGPGKISLDYLIGFTPGDVVSGLLAVLLGGVIGLVVYASRRPAEAEVEEAATRRPHAA